MRNVFLSKFVTLLVLVMLICSCAKGEWFNESDYADKWDSTPSIDLVRAMVANDMRNCGEFYFRRAKTSDECLVKCSGDGVNFKYYVIWPRIKKVQAVASSKISKP